MCLWRRLIACAWSSYILVESSQRWDRRSVCVVCRHCYWSLTDHRRRWSVPPVSTSSPKVYTLTVCRLSAGLSACATTPSLTRLTYWGGMDLPNWLSSEAPDCLYRDSPRQDP